MRNIIACVIFLLIIGLPVSISAVTDAEICKKKYDVYGVAYIAGQQTSLHQCAYIGALAISHANAKHRSPMNTVYAAQLRPVIAAGCVDGALGAKKMKMIDFVSQYCKPPKIP